MNVGSASEIPAIIEQVEAEADRMIAGNQPTKFWKLEFQALSMILEANNRKLDGIRDDYRQIQKEIAELRGMLVSLSRSEAR